jgi:type II secretory pathway component PulC
MRYIFKKNFVFIGGSLLILGIAIYIAQWKWHFLHVGQNSASIQNTPSVLLATDDDNLEAQQPMDASNNHIRDILSANLFGVEGAAKTASAEAVPKTQQPLELHGIMFIPNHPEQSVALIAQAGQLAKDYKKGDVVSSGITLAEISQDLVFIENQGAREKLELPKLDFKQTANGQSAMNPDAQFDNAQPALDTVEPAAENLPPMQENMPQVQDTMPPPSPEMAQPEAAVVQNQPEQSTDPQAVNDIQMPTADMQPTDNLQQPPASPVDNQ